MMFQRVHIPSIESLNGDYDVLRGLQNLCSFWFYLFFPTITPKVLTFNYKLHDNYKPCMKAFNPENTLFEFDECVQVSS